MKSFNIKEKRPKVLLLGNGITYSSSTQWSEIIKTLSRSEAPGLNMEGIPYSILASIETSISDNNRHDKYKAYFEKDYQYKAFPALEELMQVPFDAILTTNYTYEIENSIITDYYRRSNNSMKRLARWTKEKPDGKYLIHGFNRVANQTVTQDIWHIHGEVRRKSSMILTHDEYSHLIAKLVEYNKERGHDYFDFAEAVNFESWVDYLILGDLHILGLGFDFSEFDLWWLLTRRLKEDTGKGQIIFYTPEKEKTDGKKIAIEKALEAMGARIEHCGIQLTNDHEINKGLYQEFYKTATQIIRES